MSEVVLGGGEGVCGGGSGAGGGGGWGWGTIPNATETLKA